MPRPKILLVDDEENVLSAYYRNLKKSYEIDVALGGASALRGLEDHGPYAVIVVDQRMPGMDGLTLLAKVKERYPETTRIMLTGYSDLQMAMEAVNRGEVFRFLTKPCSPESLSMALDAGVRHYQLICAEKELLQKTLQGSLQVVTDLLGAQDPETFGRSRILQERALLFAQELGYEDEWSLSVAAQFSGLGRLLLPPETLQKLRQGLELNSIEKSLLQRVPEMGADLLEAIPRLEGAARILRHLAPQPAPLLETKSNETEISFASKLLRILVDFTEIEVRMQSRTVAAEELRLHREDYDPELLERVLDRLMPSETGPVNELSLRVAELAEGMVLSRSLRSKSGRVVLTAGVRINPAYLALIRVLGELVDIQEPAYIQKVQG